MNTDLLNGWLALPVAGLVGYAEEDNRELEKGGKRSAVSALPRCFLAESGCQVEGLANGFELAWTAADVERRNG